MAGSESGDPRLEATIARFQAAHTEDPRAVVVDGVEVPWSVHYHRRLAHWVRHFDPRASDALRLASACQHIRRWTVPRTDYEEGRAGYKRWRSDLARMHAELAGEVLAQEGWDEETIGRVQQLVRKIGLARDPEVQLFEDAICMVFFENEYADLAAKHDDEKMVDILARTWTKMSERGHAAARAMASGMPARERALLDRAMAE